MISIPKYFKSEDGIELFGLLNLPESCINNEVVISVHGQASNCVKKREQIISKFLTEKGLAYFCFNNRGSEIYKRLKRQDGNGEQTIKGGAMFEKISESYYDILGAIKYLKKLGYKIFHLMGHSLGCTKILYSYNKLIDNKDSLLKNIKSLILLSPVDIKAYYETKNKRLMKKNYSLALKYIKHRQNENLVDSDSGFQISAQTFFELFDDEINLINFDNKNGFKYFNKINIPLFFRFGEINELIIQSPQEIVDLFKNKLKNKNLNVDYVSGANHSYKNKELILAKEIYKFLEKNKNPN